MWQKCMKKNCSSLWVWLENTQSYNSTSSISELTGGEMIKQKICDNKQHYREFFWCWKFTMWFHNYYATFHALEEWKYLQTHSLKLNVFTVFLPFSKAEGMTPLDIMLSYTFNGKNFRITSLPIGCTHLHQYSLVVLIYIRYPNQYKVIQNSGEISWWKAHAACKQIQNYRYIYSCGSPGRSGAC